MSLPVLVPWRTDHGEREAIWRRLRSTVWAGWDVYEGDSPHGEFSRSAARNAAARLAGDWDLAIFADADAFVPEAQLRGAIRLSRESGRLVIPFSERPYLWPGEWDQVLSEGWISWRSDRPVKHLSVSAALVVPRRVFAAVGGYDERFSGWGFEDNAFLRSVRVMAGGVLRLHGPLWHFAVGHARKRHPNYASNRDLWRRYRAARTPEAMRALISERSAA